jgi:hypothetical protein
MNRRHLIAGAATAAGALSIPALAQEDIARSLLERFAATLSSHHIASFATLFAEDYVNHQMSAAAPAPPPGKSQKQSTVDFFAARLMGIPDLQVAVEAAVVSKDRMRRASSIPGRMAEPTLGFTNSSAPSLHVL